MTKVCPESELVEGNGDAQTIEEYWIVTVMREHLGAGEKRVFLVRGYTEVDALAIVERESGYTKMLAAPNPGNLPIGVWILHARRLSPNKITELSHSSWGGW